MWSKNKVFERSGSTSLKPHCPFSSCFVDTSLNNLAVDREEVSAMEGLETDVGYRVDYQMWQWQEGSQKLQNARTSFKLGGHFGEAFLLNILECSVHEIFISCHYLGTITSALFIIFMDVLISCSFSCPCGNFAALKSWTSQYLVETRFFSQLVSSAAPVSSYQCCTSGNLTIHNLFEQLTWVS